MKKSIAIRGISTVPVYEDGDCMELENLRWENGVLRPVAGLRRRSSAGDGYEKMFVHRLPKGNGENIIGFVRKGAGGFVAAETYDGIGSVLMSTEVREVAFAQTGNVLVVSADDLYYFMWSGKEYREVDLRGIDVFMSSYAYGGDYVHARDVSDGDVYTAIQKIMKERGEAGVYPMFEPVLAVLAVEMYDGSTVALTTPILVMPPKHVTWDNGGMSEDNMQYYQKESMLCLEEYCIDFGVKGMTREVEDVAVELSLYIAPVEILQKKYVGYNLGSSALRRPVLKAWEGWEKEVELADNFYKAASIDLKKEDSGRFPDADSYGQPLSKDELRARGRLPGFGEMWKRRRFGGMYSYNGRIHGWKETKERVGMECLMRTLSCYNPESYDGKQWKKGKTGGTNDLYVRYRVKGVEYVVKAAEHVGEGWSSTGFVSVPEEVEEMGFVWRDRVSGKWSVDERNVKEGFYRHPMLGLSYCMLVKVFEYSDQDVDVYSKEIRCDFLSSGSMETEAPVTDDGMDEEDNEWLYVSATDNAWVFRAGDVYGGNGKILSVSSNRMSVSGRNFGQFPLYVFTDDGIRMLGVSAGGEVAYTKDMVPTTDVLPVNGVTVSTPYGIAFVTNEGVQVINGEAVSDLSAGLSGLAGSVVLGGRRADNMGAAFRRFCRAARWMIYDDRKKELIVVGEDRRTCFVYDFRVRMWGRREMAVDCVVENSIPLLIRRDRDLCDFGEDGVTGTVHVCWGTRAIRFGGDGVKRLVRVIVRGRMYGVRSEDGVNFLSLWGSHDGVNFVKLRGLTLAGAAAQGRDYKDWDMGLMSRATWRYYMVRLEAEMDAGSEIERVDFEVEERYRNDKMR